MVTTVKSNKKKYIALITIIVILGVLVAFRIISTGKSAQNIDRIYGIEDIVPPPYVSGNISYMDYLKAYEGAPSPDTIITIRAVDALSSDKGADARVASYQGKEQVLVWDSQKGIVDWEFEVLEEGFYNLNINYCPVSIKGNEIHLGIMIDGAYPYRNVETIALPRLFLDETYIDAHDNAFRQDTNGNEIRPKAVEQFKWQGHTVIDNDGQYTGALKFHLTRGMHTLSLDMQMEGAAIESFEFMQAEASDSYTDIYKGWQSEGVRDTSGHLLVIQGEKAYLKSHNILFPTFDKGSFSVEPSSPYVTLYNTIGKNTWDAAGQYVSYEVDVPEDGFYHVAFKVKQNAKRGMYSVRELMIDGQTFFREMDNIKFKFNNSWYVSTFKDVDDKPYRIYLTKGYHVVRLGVTVGDTSDILRRVDDVLAEMNHWYREIIKITGTNADSGRISIDTNRDFLLDKKIPGLMEGFASIEGNLGAVMEDIRILDGIEETSATVVAEAIALMESFIKRPGRIANRIESLRGTMSSIATWTVEMRSQPLEMDYFVIYSPDVKEPRISRNVFKQAGYRFSMFLNSFGDDVNSLGNTADMDDYADRKPLTVWVSTADMAGTGGIASGRDQAMLLKRLIDDMFTPGSGIGVQVSLVNSSYVLTQAVLAGKGPDVALFVSKDTPVNLAMRGALYDLSSFGDFDEVMAQFMPSAIIPYKYKGSYYALPETQSYDMLFYRKDIFEQLGVTVPDTWKDFYALIPVLMESNLMVGIPESQRTFEMFLYQYGGTFYNESLTKTAFDTPEALRAFEEWTGLYAKYSLPLVFDFFNRFRTGEMPMAVMPYTQVNYLAVAAPELKNLWDIAPIPGTPDEQGNVNRSETANGTACIILGDTKQADRAYEFLKWWVSAEVQGRFGIELEQNMGPAARYPTANVKAFDMLPWNKEQSESLMEQWKNVTDIPQIPGNYYISRNISFAFRAVVFQRGNERESLYKYNKEINKEIARKTKEFDF